MKTSTLLIIGAVLVGGYFLLSAYTGAPTVLSPGTTPAATAVVSTAGPPNPGLAANAKIFGNLFIGPAPIHGIIPGGVF